MKGETNGETEVNVGLLEAEVKVKAAEYAQALNDLFIARGHQYPNAEQMESVNKALGDKMDQVRKCLSEIPSGEGLLAVVHGDSFEKYNMVRVSQSPSLVGSNMMDYRLKVLVGRSVQKTVTFEMNIEEN